jgi:hypothetical protein
MEALFKQYFWVVKGLGLAITAALAASVVTTYVGSSYIYGQDRRHRGRPQGDSDTDGDGKTTTTTSRSPATRAGAGSAVELAQRQRNRTKLIQAVLSTTCSARPAPRSSPPRRPAAPRSTPSPASPRTSAAASSPARSEHPPAAPGRHHGVERPEVLVGHPARRGDRRRRPVLARRQIYPGAVLVSVERRIVHVRNGGQLEYIELGVEPPKGAPKPVAEKPTKKSRTRTSPSPAARSRAPRTRSSARARTPAPSIARGSRACSPTRSRSPSRPA